MVDAGEEKKLEVVEAQGAETPLGGCLVRLIWSFGCGILLLLLVPIVVNDSERLSPLSVGFWILACLIIGARYLEMARYRGAMNADEPGTWRDVHRFAAGLVVIAGAAWSIAHAV